MMINKFYTDFFYLNSTFAQWSGISLKEINELDEEFLYIIDFNLNITAEEYQEYELAVNSFFKSENKKDIDQILNAFNQQTTQYEKQA